MSHSITKCECGAVLMQCRCMSPNKEVRVVKPCVHYFTTHSVSSTEPISMESLYELHTHFVRSSIHPPNVLKCHPSTYVEIQEYFDKKDAEEVMMGIKKPKAVLPHREFLGTIMGVDVVIDSTLKPGEWKFEDVHKRQGGISEITTEKSKSDVLSKSVRMGFK